MARSAFAARLMLVDDDALFAALMAGTLREVGYNVATVSDSGQAVRVATIFRPNLIVLDCGLRGTSELKIMDAMHREPRDPIPILILSSRRGDWHLRAMRTFGASAVLCKSAPHSEIHATIAQLLHEEAHSWPVLS